MKLWKFLRMKDGKIVSDYDKSEWQIGVWRETGFSIIEECKGLNASTFITDALRYVSGEILAEVETEGSHIDGDDKQTWERMRILRAWKWEAVHSVRLAIWCARLRLPNFEKAFPYDNRPRFAIEAAEAVLTDPSEQNRSAAESAAESAAWSAESAAESAAWSAESAAWSAESAAWSAASAARSAAWSAASAARSAASAAESVTKQQIHDWIVAEIVPTLPVIANPGSEPEGR